jgi:hypothetical protein
MKWEVSLAKWRESRNLTEPLEVYDEAMDEEKQEYITALADNDWDGLVDAVCDQLVFTTNQLFTEGHGNQLNGAFFVTGNDTWEFGKDNRNALMQTRSKLITALGELGVVVDLAMKEAVKHISCRKQDPIQAYEWELNGPSGKWQKDKSQPESELYQPNYLRCKRNK